ncbi:protein trichome birefringence-like 19 [Salvia miltiorrhiza]|uniref:protein trichome birefringence-like 19 n=1 Tax=Salvia miltiorrhiza TaxID=226208 RepID=UPI0025AD9430|nr:protein trichome birefringence-like 19 [Salvia miltiorrhiza]
MELPVNKSITNIGILISVALILLSVIRLNYPTSLRETSPLSTYETSVESSEACDIFAGEWVPDPDAPYYTNKTCWAIHEHQNCMKYGRPDSDFMKWRWKPDDCDLPAFDPFLFLDMLRDKSVAFVGDSVGRNQMQSMICLLSKVEYPMDESPASDEQFKQWGYVNYNFTLAYFRSPFLVRSEERDPDGPTHTGLFNLYLDEPDDSWASQIDSFDYLILNAGHWFTRAAVYLEARRVSGCHFCQLPNVTDLHIAYAYRRAFRTAFRAVNRRRDFGGVAFLRTFAPSHFEGGLWNEGGNCVRRRPFRSNETILEGVNLDLYMIELEEFRAAEREGEGRGKKKKWRLMDTTQASLLRPDGHPSRYGHWPNENVTLYNDCVHWCLPGPIDNWAQMLQHMIKVEARQNYKERLSLIQRQKKMQ